MKPRVPLHPLWRVLIAACFVLMQAAVSAHEVEGALAADDHIACDICLIAGSLGQGDAANSQPPLFDAGACVPLERPNAPAPRAYSNPIRARGPPFPN
ncbi:MAG: hypothetical protein SVU69_13130 [Pseudomonadota bacterium]|nr:hypothetical protein [Pseudomonadota bacterium]